MEKYTKRKDKIRDSKSAEFLIDDLYKEKGVKHITFKNLYEDMKFNKEDENVKWNSIKDIFKVIESNN